MGFFLVALILWSLIVASIILIIWGVWKQSWQAFLLSGLAFLIPSLILATQKGWFSLFVLLPLIAFGLSFYMKKRLQK